MLVPLLRAERELMLSDEEAHTKPGTLLKSQIPIRTWAEWDDAVPGFVEIDLVGHEGGNSLGEFCFTLTETDIATGWTVNRSVRIKAAKWVLEALEHVAAVFPFPIIGIDSGNGSEFINDHLFAYCHAHQITFTRSRPGKKNDGAHVEQKNWARVRELVGYLRYDTAAELEKLNEIWELDRIFTNYLPGTPASRHTFAAAATQPGRRFSNEATNQPSRRYCNEATGMPALRGEGVPDSQRYGEKIRVRHQPSGEL